MDDLISRQAAIDEVQRHRENVLGGYEYDEGVASVYAAAHNHIIEVIKCIPSAQPEQPPYVAEIEAEYQKAVKMPHIHKPLAKALYEVWKKHDREDAERKTDG